LGYIHLVSYIGDYVQTPPNSRESNSSLSNMVVSIVPTQIIVPLESVKLGRLITSVEQPQQSYHDPPSTREPSILTTRQDDFTGDRVSDRSSGIVSTLLSVISGGFSRRTRSTVSIATDCVKTYALGNSDSWFDEATTLPETREWIERVLDRDQKVYLIVGFHTVTNARLHHQSIVGKKAEGQLQAPAASALGAMGAAVPFGDILDSRIHMQLEVIDGERSQSSALGEYVCAIQYRKLRHNWLSSKDMDSSQLSKVRQWSSMEVSRDEEDGEDDVVQVDLIDLDGFENWEKHVTKDGNETFLLNSHIDN
jgi:hypothetical protein